MPSGVSSRFSFTGIEYESSYRYAQISRMDREVLDQRVVVARQLQGDAAGQRTFAILSSSSHHRRNSPRSVGILTVAELARSMRDLPLPEN